MGGLKFAVIQDYRVWCWIKRELIKGDCWALAELFALLSAVCSSFVLFFASSGSKTEPGIRGVSVKSTKRPCLMKEHFFFKAMEDFQLWANQLVLKENLPQTLNPQVMLLFVNHSGPFGFECEGAVWGWPSEIITDCFFFWSLNMRHEKTFALIPKHGGWKKLAWII